MDLTPYLVLSSLDRGADISRLRMCEGAEKWRFLDLERSEDTCLFNFIFWNKRMYLLQAVQIYENPRFSHCDISKLNCMCSMWWYGKVWFDECSWVAPCRHSTWKFGKDDITAHNKKIYLFFINPNKIYKLIICIYVYALHVKGVACRRVNLIYYNIFMWI